MYFVRKLNSRCILSVLSEIGPSRAIRAAAMLSGPFVPEFAINIKIINNKVAQKSTFQDKLASKLEKSVIDFICREEKVVEM